MFYLCAQGSNKMSTPVSRYINQGYISDMSFDIDDIHLLIRVYFVGHKDTMFSEAGGRHRKIIIAKDPSNSIIFFILMQHF